MSWIFRLIPFPVILFLLGLACLALTGALFNYENGKRIARETGAPDAVAVSRMQPIRGFPWFEETTIRVQASEDLSYVYWYENESTEFPVIFLVDPDHEGPVQEVLGAFSYTSLEDAEVGAYLEQAYVEDGALGPIFELTGVRALSPPVTMEEIDWAAADLGVTVSENFFYIEPHFAGRETIVEARPELYFVAGLIGVLLIWFSMIAAIIRKKWMRRERDGGSTRAAAKKGVVAAAVGGIAKLADGGDGEGFI